MANPRILSRIHIDQFSDCQETPHQALNLLTPDGDLSAIKAFGGATCVALAAFYAKHVAEHAAGVGLGEALRAVQTPRTSDVFNRSVENIVHGDDIPYFLDRVLRTKSAPIVLDVDLLEKQILTCMREGDLNTKVKMSWSYGFYLEGVTS